MIRCKLKYGGDICFFPRLGVVVEKDAEDVGGKRTVILQNGYRFVVVSELENVIAAFQEEEEKHV